MNKKWFTFLGIVISYVTISGVNWIFKTYNGEVLNNAQVVSKELIILAVVALLLLLIKRGERLGLDSIGLTFSNYGKSLKLSLLIIVSTVVAAIAAVLISQAVGWSFGESKAFDNLSPLVVTLIVIRAGVAEEVFMRGYLLERFTTLTGSKTAAAALSLIPFALLHYPGQGWAGVLVSFAAGAVLTFFYFRYRDLKANVFAHFMVDFIPNVILPLFIPA